MLHDEDAGGVDVGNVDVSGYADLYKGEQGHENEPEIRKRLRAQREKAKHDQMKAALKAKQEMEAEEAARREQQVELKEQYKTNIEAWKNKNKGNIRGLLSSLQTVLWPDSGWAPVSVGDMLEPVQVKKVWMRANLLVHPDKVRQRNGTAEQVAIADMVFDVLKDTYNTFSLAAAHGLPLHGIRLAAGAVGALSWLAFMLLGGAGGPATALCSMDLQYIVERQAGAPQVNNQLTWCNPEQVYRAAWRTLTHSCVQQAITHLSEPAAAAQAHRDP
eukprot:XP_001691066.1 predicted protein [Chlamydomonas reinhardtii]